MENFSLQKLSKEWKERGSPLQGMEGGAGGFINRAAAVIELFVLSILNLKLL